MIALQAVSSIEQLLEADNEAMYFDKFGALEKLIISANKIVIFRHIAPDADAQCSQEALASAIRKKYPIKEVILATEDSEIEMEDNDLCIFLDLGEYKRIAGKFIGNPKTARIDHHPTGMMTDATIEVKDAGSTAALLCLFFKYFNYPISKYDGEKLFTAINADTGRFLYQLQMETLEAIRFLISIGVDYKKVYSKMYLKTPESLKIKQYVLNNVKIMPNGVAFIYINDIIAARLNTTVPVMGALVHELDDIKGSPIWLAIQDYGNKINVRLRSRNIPIDKIANKYDGGGHENAAGLSFKNKLAVKEFLTKLDGMLGEYKNGNTKVFNEDLTLDAFKLEKNIIDEAIEINSLPPSDRVLSIDNTLTKIFKDFKYGYIEDGVPMILDSDDESIRKDFWDRFYKNGKFSTIDDTMKYKVGMCQTVTDAIEHILKDNMNIPCRKWFSCFSDRQHPHSVLTYEDSGNIVKIDFTPKATEKWKDFRSKVFKSIDDFIKVRTDEGKIIKEYTGYYVAGKTPDQVIDFIINEKV